MKIKLLKMRLLAVVLIILQLFMLPCGLVSAVDDVTITLKGLSGYKGYLTLTNADTGAVLFNESSSGNTVTVPSGTHISVVPHGINGYEFATLKVGSDLMPRNGFSFTVTANVNLTVTYQLIKTYAVTFKEPANGQLSLSLADGTPISSGQAFVYGTVINVTATPANSQYELKTIKAGTLDITATKTFTVTKATAVTATFGLTDYAASLRTITVKGVTGATGYLLVKQNDSNGAVLFDNNSGGNTFQVPSGTKIYVEAIGANGYKASSLKLGSDSIPTDGATAVIYNNTTLTVKFEAIKTYAVTFEQPEHGHVTVTANGAALYSGQTVVAGTEINIEATADPDYIVKSVKANTSDVTQTKKYVVNAATKIVTSIIDDPASTKVTVSVKGMTGTSGTVIIKDTNGNVLSDNGTPVKVAPGTRLEISTTGTNGFKPSTLKVNSENISPKGGTITVLTDTVITVTFEKIKYITITWVQPLNGSISVADDAGNPISSGDMIEMGTLVRITPTPLQDFHLSQLTANKEDILASKYYVCQKDTVIIAKFSPGAAGVNLTTVTIAGVTGVNGDVAIFEQTPEGTKLMDTADGEVSVSVPTGTKLYVRPVAAKGYTVASIKVGNDELNTKGFYMTALNDVTITVKFEKLKSYKVLFANRPTGGFVGVTADGETINNGDTVPAGTVITVAATPKAGYSLAEVKANGDSIIDTMTYTVTKDTTITCKFTKGVVNPDKTYYTIKITGLTGVTGNLIIRQDSNSGTILFDGNSGAREVYVEEGAKIFITAEGKNGYTVSSMKIDGQTANPDGTTMYVISDSVIALKFDKTKGYTVSWKTPVVGGTLTVIADGALIKNGSTVQSGTEISVVPSPKSGYTLKSLTANGQDITTDYKYTVTKNTKLDVVFQQTEYVLTVKHPTGSKIEVTYVKDGVDTVVETGTKLPVNTVLTVNAEALPGYEMSSLYIHETGNAGKKASLKDGSRFYLETNITVSGTFTSTGEGYQPVVSEDPSIAGWEKITEYLINSPAGATIAIDMNGATVLPAATGEAIKGRDLTLLLNFEDYYWRIKTKKYTEAADEDMELTVDTDALLVPSALISDYANGNGYVEFELSHDGLFGFETDLVILMGEGYSGKFATLYYYNEATKDLDFQASDRVAKDGSVIFRFKHASSYVMIIAGKPMATDISVAAGAEG